MEPLAFHKLCISYMPCGTCISQHILLCRKEIAATSLPDGVSYYRECIRFHTSTELTPEEIHKIGLEEVEKIEKEMREVWEEAF